MYENMRAAQDVQHKMEFYLIALAFTMAGFAIQTMTITGNMLIDLSLITSIALIILSGVLGIYRTDYIPVIYRASDQLDVAEKIIAMSNDPGRIESIDLTAEEITQHAKNKKSLEKLNNKFGKLYYWNRGIFLLGLTLLFIAKGTASYLLNA